jgi:hypothetical protein
MKSNHRFLLNYGFSLEGNVEVNGMCPNQVPLQLEVSKSDPLYRARMTYWMWEGADAAESSSNGEEEEDEEEEEEESDEEEEEDEEQSDDEKVEGELDEIDDNEEDSDEGKDCDNDEITSVETAARCTLIIADDESEVELQRQSSGTVSPSEADDDIEDVGGEETDDDDGDEEDDDDEEEGEEEDQFDDDDRIRSLRLSIADDENVHTMLSLLRTLACDQAELAMIAGISEQPPIEVYGTCEELNYPVSLKNERKAMELLVDMITTSLNRYPRTLEQDAEDLQDHDAYPPFSNCRNAKIQVKGEKEVLHYYLDFGQTALKVIDVIENETKADAISFETCITEMANEAIVHRAIICYCDETLDYLRGDEVYSSAANNTHIDISGLR